MTRGLESPRSIPFLTRGQESPDPLSHKHQVKQLTFEGLGLGNLGSDVFDLKADCCEDIGDLGLFD